MLFRSARGAPTEFSGATRRLLIEASLRIWTRHPILGVGPGQAGYFLPNEDPRLLEDGRRERRIVNNVYAEHLAETGAVGLAAWFFLLGTIVVPAIRSVRRRPLPLLAIGVLLLGMNASPSHLMPYLWVA